jgi:hypothetical protein
VGIPLWCKYFNKLCLIQQIEYGEKGKVSKVSYKSSGYDVDGARILMMLLLIALVAAGLLIVLL